MTAAARSVGRSRSAARLRSERGAAAVEFALVVPLLLMLFLGIVEFTMALQDQARLSAAAREGARMMALGSSPADARTAVQGAVSSLTIPDDQISVTPGSCDPDDLAQIVTVTVSYTRPFASGLFGSSGVDLSGEAVMRCGG